MLVVKVYSVSFYALVGRRIWSLNWAWVS